MKRYLLIVLCALGFAKNFASEGRKGDGFFGVWAAIIDGIGSAVTAIGNKPEIAYPVLIGAAALFAYKALQEAGEPCVHYEVRRDEK